MEPGLQQRAGDKVPLKIQIRNAIALVSYLDAACRIECEFDPVAAH